MTNTRIRVGHWTLPFKEFPQTKLFKLQAEFKWLFVLCKNLYTIISHNA